MGYLRSETRDVARLLLQCSELLLIPRGSHMPPIQAFATGIKSMTAATVRRYRGNNAESFIHLTSFRKCKLTLLTRNVAHAEFKCGRNIKKNT